MMSPRECRADNFSQPLYPIIIRSCCWMKHNSIFCCCPIILFVHRFFRNELKKFLKFCPVSKSPIASHGYQYIRVFSHLIKIGKRKSIFFVENRHKNILSFGVIVIYKYSVDSLFRASKEETLFNEVVVSSNC